MSRTPRLYHPHTSTDPLHSDGRTVNVKSHCDAQLAAITSSGALDAMYVHADDVPSMIVALIANTGFLDREPRSEVEGVLQGLAGQFLDTFREGMVPQFRHELQKALDEARDDWDAKCRVSRVIKRYEDLR